jgi:hypothetical protein
MPHPIGLGLFGVLVSNHNWPYMRGRWPAPCISFTRLLHF